MRQRGSLDVIGGSVSSAGVLLYSTASGVGVQRTAAGLYTVTLPANFRIVHAIATMAGGIANQNSGVDTLTNRSFRIAVIVGGLVADGPSLFTAYGYWSD